MQQTILITAGKIYESNHPRGLLGIFQNGTCKFRHLLSAVVALLKIKIWKRKGSYMFSIVGTVTKRKANLAFLSHSVA